MCSCMYQEETPVYLLVLGRGHGAYPKVAASPPRHGACPKVAASPPGHGACPKVAANPPGHGACPKVAANPSGHGACPKVAANPPGHGACPKVAASLPGHGACPKVAASLPGHGACPKVAASLPGHGACPKVNICAMLHFAAHGLVVSIKPPLPPLVVHIGSFVLVLTNHGVLFISHHSVDYCMAILCRGAWTGQSDRASISMLWFDLAMVWFFLSGRGGRLTNSTVDDSFLSM